MEEKLRYDYIRRTSSTQGWALLVYLGILNVAVICAVFVELFAELFRYIGESHFGESVPLGFDSGWGYFLAIAGGALALRLWKKKGYCRTVVWQPGKPMKAGRFLAIVCVFFSVQMVAVVLSLAAQSILRAMGYQTVDMGSVSTDSWSMFLYVGLGAPISEEILFRGLVLRTLEPFGKKFAIVTSALLFGLFHGNLSQAPFAFGVGLILGYVALEYNVGWAMVLHMLNNLTLSDTLYRLLGYLPGYWGDLCFWGILLAFTIAAVVILIANRKRIGAYLRGDWDDPLAYRAFFRAPGVITLMVVLLLSIGLTTAMSIMPIG